MTRRIVIYPGSFDPVTNGHLDILHRASRLFDHVVVAVSDNSLKTPLFSLQERRDMLEKVLAAEIRRKNVSVDIFNGLLADYARRIGASAVVRGLRALSDFEFEFQMALMNRHLSPEMETVFLMPDEKYTYLSSTLLKEIVRLKGRIEKLIPAALLPQIRDKIRRRFP